MKKSKGIMTLIPILCAIVLMTILSGCDVSKPGASFIENNVKSSLEIPDYSKYVTLGAYTGLEYTIPDTYTYSDEDIEEDIKMEVQTTFSELTEERDVTDRPAKDMDNVNITYTGLLNGEPFENSDSPAEGVDIVLGYSGYPEGFEAGIVGMKTGETKEISAVLNDEANNGETAIYTVTVNRIFEYAIPDITDEMVQKYTKYQTYDEYIEGLRNAMTKETQDTINQYKLNTLLGQIVANATFSGYPEGSVDTLVQQATDVLNDKATSMNITADEYLTQYANMSGMDEFKASIKSDAEAYMRIRMALCEIARQEGVTISQSEMDAYKDMLRSYYGLDSNADVSAYESDDDILFECIVAQIQPFLLDVNTAKVESTTATEDTAANTETSTEPTDDASTETSEAN